MHLIDKIFVRFIIVGFINTGIGAGVMFALYNCFGVNYWLSSAANYVAGSILSFFLNKYFTFHIRQWSAVMVIAFAVNIAICYLVAYGIAKPAVAFLLRQAPQPVWENIALFTGMCLFTGLNYCGQRIVVFRKLMDQGEKNEHQS
jgi:putative flippase GtrA